MLCQRKCLRPVLSENAQKLTRLQFISQHNEMMDDEVSILKGSHNL